jgi:hypothetical protein
MKHRWCSIVASESWCFMILFKTLQQLIMLCPLRLQTRVVWNLNINFIVLKVYFPHVSLEDVSRNGGIASLVCNLRSGWRLSASRGGRFTRWKERAIFIEWDVPQSLSGHFGEETNVLLLSEKKPRFLCCPAPGHCTKYISLLQISCIVDFYTSLTVYLKCVTVPFF